jgi:tripartite-type tricarboxylate transporter receptor subunit TctC
MMIIISVAARMAQSVVGLACALALSLAIAQDYPSRPITLVVAYPPGGSVDLIARLVAPHLAERLGQRVIVENIGGASGIIATTKVITAAPDGYTLQLGSGREINIAKLINPNVAYEWRRDLSPISLAATTPMVLVGGPKLKAEGTIDDLLAAARVKPGQITYATSGIGSPQHLVGELIKIRSGVDITHVAYKGGTAGIMEVLGGHVDLSIIVLSSALPYINAGKLKAFGVSEAKRSPVAPNIPALAETTSLADVDIGIWFGLLAPAKVPDALLQRLNEYFIEALKQPNVVAKLTGQGIGIVGSSQAEFQAYIQTDTDRYRRIVQSANIRAE